MKGSFRGAVAASLLVVSLGCAKKPPTYATTDLTLELPKAKVIAPEAKYVAALAIAAAGEKRNVIFMHPTSSAEFPARAITPGTRLRFGIGVNEQVWDKPGDGVLFAITATKPGAKPVEVFSRYINPKAVPGDRRWLDVDLPLDGAVGPAVTLTFSTGPGPKGNNSYDWAGWSSPLLLEPR